MRMVEQQDFVSPAKEMKTKVAFIAATGKNTGLKEAKWKTKTKAITNENIKQMPLQILMFCKLSAPASPTVCFTRPT